MATGIGYSSSTASYSATTQGHIGSPASSSNLGMADREPVDSTSAMINAQTTPSTASHMMAATRAYGVGQPAYQMELSTESGPMILPVEVDVQQASKLADEKRKRNAGASARFRQRRKEKEQAASHHIADLQKQVRDMTEERDFYLAERNIFRDILSRTPGASIPPRPASPRMRRLQPHGLRHDQGDPSPAQRRRTSAYQPSFAAASIPTTSYANPFPQPQGPAYTLPPPSLAPGLPDPRGQPPQPPAGSGLLGPPIPPRAPHQMPPALAPNPQPPNTRSAPYDSFQGDTQ
ncbi:hypothetical protein LTR05_000819 [Lithohypha guttulata]|uniref:BZIP domain-containing protein n=1 Tax=Lithohypha guttulata TaxID=1690604 RepID=A0AAN7TCJ3_9EURO|nr:hypothetical protein LTR05_000819 [Lithohypha guttulata]